MYKKLISSILIVAILNLVGCYSTEVITEPEFDKIEKDKPESIHVITKDSKEYHFSESNFYVENDTLYGKSTVRRELSFEGKFALTEIESIQIESFSVTISGYQKIEAKSGKPDDIYLTKYDSTRYRFMKADYYIENDTLYGKGKLLVGAREELVGKNIALSEIESVEFEYFNWVTTSLLVLGIAAILGGVFLYLVAANMNIK